jgi:hypothetical protein
MERYTSENDEFVSKCRLVEKPDLCDDCVYNRKYKDWDYKKWKEYKTRINKFNRILKKNV